MKTCLFAAPKDRPSDVEYMIEYLTKEGKQFTAINLNQLLEQGKSEKEINQLVFNTQRDGNCEIHFMQPNDKEFYYTDKWLQRVFYSWNSLANVYWWKSKTMPVRR